jgi:Asp-tRNA(Asn)/Glu-tRNA(Gln) amidotransferase C subunit
MSAKKITKEEAERIVKECNSIADFCRKVGWVPMGDNYKTFHRYEKEYGLDTSHFTGVKTNIGNANNKCREKTAAE